MRGKELLYGLGRTPRFDELFDLLGIKAQELITQRLNLAMLFYDFVNGLGRDQIQRFLPKQDGRETLTNFTIVGADDLFPFRLGEVTRAGYVLDRKQIKQFLKPTVPTAKTCHQACDSIRLIRAHDSTDRFHPSQFGDHLVNLFVVECG